MTIICAKLRINDSEFDILRMSYGFYRKTDRKGRPGTGLRGGNIYVLIESGTDNYLLRQMLLEEVPSVRGSIEVMTGQDEQRMRYLEFESAYIFSQEEVMFGYSSYPMLTTIAISPVRFDIDGKVRLDRRWPETYGFWWQEYKPEEVKKVSRTETEQNFTIEDAYWLDDKGRKIRDLSIGMPVTLYVVLGQFSVGRSIHLTFESEEADGVKKADYSGIVNSDGMVVIEDFKLQAVNREEKK